ncbi:MAG: Crp/Fnr family transcriptional regulator, partial [Firmicutes bacterium]|nr:Crp/Fnr family transcriptional regulator [Bacillota bacterium]
EKVIIYKEERERSFLLENATERYENFVQGFPDIHKRIKLKYIASYLGISPESLSRIRRKLTFVNEK